MTENSSCDDIAVFILAAGRSVRMGRPKQLMLWQGTSLIERACSTALEAHCGPVIAVLGAYSEAIKEIVEAKNCAVVVNRDYSQGMSTSIRTAAQFALGLANAKAMMFLNCDQPKISSEHLVAMCSKYRASNSLDAPSIVVTKFGDTFGSPALFDRSYFKELSELEGDKGAKLVALRYLERVEQIHCQDAAFDLDTPQDFD